VFHDTQNPFSIVRSCCVAGLCVSQSPLIFSETGRPEYHQDRSSGPGKQRKQGDLLERCIQLEACSNKQTYACCNWLCRDAPLASARGQDGPSIRTDVSAQWSKTCATKLGLAAEYTCGENVPNATGPRRDVFGIPNELQTDRLRAPHHMSPNSMNTEWPSLHCAERRAPLKTLDV
jgi:hypothetical protein